jgi:sugar phosphate isomerase/epimerase
VARRLSLAYLTVSGATLPEQVSAAAEARFDAVGLRLQHRAPYPELWRDSALIDETVARLRDTGVSVLDCEVLWLMPETRVAELAGLFDVMQRLQSRLLLTLSRDPERQRLQDNFTAVCELAARYEVRPCLEFSKITAIETLGDAVNIVQSSGQSNARVLVDSLHLSRSGGTPGDVRQVDPALFEYVQLCDAPAAIPDLERMRLEPNDRMLPGQGGLPLVDLLRALPADLPVAVEAPVKSFESMPASERAWMAMEGIKSILERV